MPLKCLLVQESIADLMSTVWSQGKVLNAGYPGPGCSSGLPKLANLRWGPGLRTETGRGWGRKVRVSAESLPQTQQRTSSRSQSQAVPPGAGQAVRLSVWTPRGGEESRRAEFLSQSGVLRGWSEGVYLFVSGCGNKSW